MTGPVQAAAAREEGDAPIVLAQAPQRSGAPSAQRSRPAALPNIPPRPYLSAQGVRLVEDQAGLPQAHFARIECMDGTTAANIRNSTRRWSDPTNAGVTVGEYCRGVMELSATVEGNGRVYDTLNRNDLSPLSPYGGFAIASGASGAALGPGDASEADARAVLADMFRVGGQNNVRDVNQPMQFQGPVSGLRLNINPGIVADARFSAIVTDYINGRNAGRPVQQPAPPTMSEQAITEALGRCFTSGQATFGECRVAGEQAASSYIVRAFPRVSENTAPATPSTQVRVR